MLDEVRQLTDRRDQVAAQLLGDVPELHLQLLERRRSGSRGAAKLLGKLRQNDLLGFHRLAGLHQRRDLVLLRLREGDAHPL